MEQKFHVNGKVSKKRHLASTRVVTVNAIRLTMVCDHVARFRPLVPPYMGPATLGLWSASCQDQGSAHRASHLPPNLPPSTTVTPRRPASVRH
jgi:hypothetical protein